VFVLSDDPPMLKVWIAGPNVGDAYRLGLGTNGAAVIAAIERARPAARGQLSLLRRFDWGLQPFAGGIYHHIGAQHGATLAAATAHVGRRLHFAGEHLAIAASGMEGALESGERAAQTVLARS
jgi:monoamine oxidase